MKTLTDGQAATVIAAAPQPNTVGALTALSAPTTLPATSRVGPTELQQFTVQAVLIAWKQEGTDSDFHLVLADPKDHGKTMIAEIPSPKCASACASAKVGAFGVARDALTKELGPVPHTTSVTVLNPPRKVTVTGVGLFDFYHKQDGVAVNCLELHPVLEITVTGNADGGPIPVPKLASYHCGSPGAGKGGVRGKGKTGRPSTP